MRQSAFLTKQANSNSVFQFDFLDIYTTGHKKECVHIAKSVCSYRRFQCLEQFMYDDRLLILLS